MPRSPSLPPGRCLVLMAGSGGQTVALVCEDSGAPEAPVRPVARMILRWGELRDSGGGHLSAKKTYELQTCEQR